MSEYEAWIARQNIELSYEQLRTSRDKNHREILRRLKAERRQDRSR
ncbi:hypothetical protein [Bradyrhizobium viridifuturi]|nr:hypothetical protein [Bradyrhizobium viridifuturi]